MKRIIAAAALVLTAGVAHADPIEGIWKTQPDDGAYAHVRIQPCGGAFCGTIIRTFNSSGEYKSENIGKQLVRNMAPAGGAPAVLRPSAVPITSSSRKMCDPVATKRNRDARIGANLNA